MEINTGQLIVIGGSLLPLLYGIIQWVKGNKAAARQIVDPEGNEAIAIRARLEATITEQKRANQAVFDLFLASAANMRVELDSVKAQMAEANVKLARLPELEAISARQEQQITNLQSDAQTKEQQYKMQTAAQAAKIAEQDIIITKQNGQIKALMGYFEALLPLLKKAGIKTEELPKLPDILDTAHGEAALVKPPAAE